MTVVAVTGASGYLGRHLCEALSERDDVRRVIGLDVTDPSYSTRNLEFYRLDVRSPAVREVIAGSDVLAHLAFVLASRDTEEMRDVNVGGTRNVLAAAGEAGVRKVIYPSSVMAYGAHPDNDFPLTEESPVRPVRDFAYSAHKAECEELVGGFREAHPDVTVTVLRPAMVLGPTAEGIVARGTVESPVSVGVEGYEPPMQFVHETDVARTLVFALDHDLDGAYNVCPGDWVSPDRYAELLEKRRTVMPVEQATKRAERMYAIGLSAVQPSFLPFLMYPWVMSNAKLTEAGFAFLHSTEGTLLSAAEGREGRVSVGPVRFKPRNAALALVGAALVGGSIVRRLARRR